MPLKETVFPLLRLPHPAAVPALRIPVSDDLRSPPFPVTALHWLLIVPSGSGSGDTALHQNPHKTGMGPSAAGKASPCFPAYPLPPDPIPVLHGPEPFSISVRSFHMPGTDHPFCCFLSGNASPPAQSPPHHPDLKPGRFPQPASPDPPHNPPAVPPHVLPVLPGRTVLHRYRSSHLRRQLL